MTRPYSQHQRERGYPPAPRPFAPPPAPPKPPRRDDAARTAAAMIEEAAERYAAHKGPQRALEKAVAEHILGLQGQLRRALDEVQELRDGQVHIVLLRAQNCRLYRHILMLRWALGVTGALHLFVALYCFFWWPTAT